MTCLTGEQRQESGQVPLLIYDLHTWLLVCARSHVQKYRACLSAPLNRKMVTVPSTCALTLAHAFSGKERPLKEVQMQLGRK